MQYFGGKNKISKEVSEFINKYLIGNNKTFVDLFCGSCNITTKIDKNRKVIANDKHEYLISMWNDLKSGWIPPTDISKEEYLEIKNNLDENKSLSGFVGFGCSYSGKWFGGYAKDNNGRNYCKNAHNSTMKKVEKLKDVIFQNKDYSEVEMDNDSVIYCDIPYRGTTGYSKNQVDNFDHDKFYEWCIENKDKYKILISEYRHNIPDGFEILLEIESNKSMRNKNGIQEKTYEIIFTPKN